VAPSRDLVRRAGRSRLRRTTGVIERLDTDPPPGSVVVGRDALGPESAPSVPGPQLVHAAPAPAPVAVPSALPPDAVPTAPAPGVTAGGRRAERATQESDSGRRGKGSIFGAFRPATGAALTPPYPSRGAANWADFPGRVATGIPGEVERVDALVDHRNAHRTVEVPRFALALPGGSSSSRRRTRRT
jgi:hypothetical protein